MLTHLYSIVPGKLETSYKEMVATSRRQGIDRFYLLAAVTGKLTASPDEIRSLKKRLEADGLQVLPLVFAIGHPQVHKYYDANGQPPKTAPYYTGGLVFDTQSARWTQESLVPGGGPRVDHAEDAALEDKLYMLPQGWQYAVSDLGKPIFTSACADRKCREGNAAVIRALAPIFDEIWYDDEFRMDGDQLAGTPFSTASCYCDECLAETSRRVGRPVTRADVLSDPALHAAWTETRTDKLRDLWKAIWDAGRTVNPKLKLGLMIRWGGEERDGLDIEKILAVSGRSTRLRVGEGHFKPATYSVPLNQAVEYLAASYHVSWFPRETSVLTETTYIGEMLETHILKKVALALAAGAQEPAYCPCVPNYALHQDFMKDHRERVAHWIAAFADKAALFDPVVILRTSAAARGDQRPERRVRDRQPFPLLSAAGLSAVVNRQGSWRDRVPSTTLALTGRSVLDVDPARLEGRHLILDGHALMEKATLLDRLGIRKPERADNGRVAFESDFRADGLLYTRDAVTVIPYIWQDVPEAVMPGLLADIRRVIGGGVNSAVVEGDVFVLPVHYRFADRDLVLLVNLTSGKRRIRLRVPKDRPNIRDEDGRSCSAEMELKPDEIRLVDLLK